MDWLPGALQLHATSDGGAQDTTYPPRLVLHTTEGGGTVESLAAFYKTSTFWPNFTADLTLRKIAQHIPLSRGGRALKHDTATKTNTAHCIQVEIIGHAGESPAWPVAGVEWLARTLAPVLDALAIPRRAPKFIAGGAGLHAPQRMTEAAWRTFSGVCGHQHVPENDHWDPGAIDINAFLNAATIDMEEAVKPEFDPPKGIRPEVSDCDCPSGGAWGVTSDGAVQAHGSAPYLGGPFGAKDAAGHVYFDGHTAAEITTDLTAAEKAGHKRYVVIATNGDRYAYP